MIGENGRIVGGSERHVDIVGACMLISGGPMGEVDLERSLDGGWSCRELVAVRAVEELCGLVWGHTTMVHTVVQGVQTSSPRVHLHRLIGALSRRPGPVPLSADDRELAEPRLRYDNDKSPRLQKRLWAFVECLYCGRCRRD